MVIKIQRANGQERAWHADGAPQNAYRIKILSKHFLSAATGVGPSFLSLWQMLQSTVLAGVVREDEFPWKRDKWKILFGKLRLLLKVWHVYFPLVRKKVTICQWSFWLPVLYPVNPYSKPAGPLSCGGAGG